MKIYFGCSTSQFLKYQEYYLAIRDFLVEEGHILTRDWLGIYRDALLNHPEKLLISSDHGPEKVYQLATKAFYEAEVLIAEDTVSSFSNGHLMTLALQRKMPVLVLHIQGKKKTYLKKSFIQGIKSDYLEIKQYDLSTYKQIIRTFLKKYEDSFIRHRFHLVIDEVERKYLDWAQFNEKRAEPK